MVQRDVGSSADPVELLCQVAEQLSELLTALSQRTLGGVDGDALPRVLAFSRPVMSDDFSVTEIRLTSDVRKILSDNPRRISFAVRLLTGRLYRFARTDFAVTAAVPEIDGTSFAQFGLDGHVGELWASVDSTNSPVQVIEQFAD